MTMGFSVYRGARLAARVAVATENLRQVSVGLELYFGRYYAYPPPGSDLGVALGPFLKDTSVLRNPLTEEAFPGQTLTDLYRPQSLAQLDSPGRYVTAFVPELPGTGVVLQTGSIVKPIELTGTAGDRNALLAALTEDDAANVGTLPAPYQAPALSQTQFNLNPSNSTDFEFDMGLPDGTFITRDQLLASGGKLDYCGPATRIRLRPKGNGFQNGLSLGDSPYSLRNARVYVIEGGAINVHLYNSKRGQGAAMAKWYLDIGATGATIKELG
jgi:hypothetical protein